MSAPDFRHEPVLAREVLELLAPAPGELFVDGTLGGGGHARLILAATAPAGRLIGFDRDRTALQAAQQQLAGFAERAVFCHGNFAGMAEHLHRLDIDRVDGILLDLGVSSPQLDTAERGFSFREDGPLDMRMDQNTGASAAELLATADQQELRRIFRDYGEERWAGRIAREIVRCRQQAPLAMTLQLAELVCRVVPGGRAPQRIHPATRVFQALRIAVNGELDALAAGLQAGLELLAPGGRMAVISFHSLEDRMVKQTFRQAASGCQCPPRLAVCVCGLKPRFRLLNRRAIRAGEAEQQSNPRSRSAVLRGVQRLTMAPKPEESR
ncbi:MAG: 16S rRNA (cytosine(1402)-N(4))-methyltransferase RsmH [Desulfuromonadales bacterium]|nr:16S rRNA (cytosine(1402)-N(4))-methyltransferase RsmH [Desulfuromonadales bacterium]